MKKKVKKYLYNVISLGLFLCGLYFFLLKFSGVSILIVFQDDIKFGSDYWLDQPLVVYMGFLVTYIVHWILLVCGHKFSLVPKWLVWGYFALDVFVVSCGTFLGNCLSLFVFINAIIGEFHIDELIKVLCNFCPLFLPQYIICAVILFIRVFYTNRVWHKKTD